MPAYVIYNTTGYAKLNTFVETTHWYFLMPECIKSVSYTHLDVYKRQIIYLSKYITF